MTPLDIHPEHLIDRVLAGDASEQERAELQAHVQVCAGCAAEMRLAGVLRSEQRGQSDAHDHGGLVDRERAASRAVDAVLAELVREGRIALPADAQASLRAGRRSWLPWAVAACLFFTGSAAAATLIVAVRLSSRPAPVAQAVASAGARARAHAGHAAPAQAAPGVVAPAAVDTAPVREALPVERSRARAPAGQRLDAAGLFEQARAASMRGEHAAAAALYTTLEQRFARSDQAHVARVLLGRLYLERLGDARAALEQFDTYLAQAGVNRPEALLGRARALRKLGREREEIATLRELVDAYPDSLYVGPAQQRLRSAQ